MRLAEWAFVAFFAYITLLSGFFPARPQLSSFQALPYLLGSIALFLLLGRLERGSLSMPVAVLRDWLPMLLTLIAFREMELFVPAENKLWFETGWIQLDRQFLHDWGIHRMIESWGAIFPFYLEVCYLLVYGLAAYSLAWIVARANRRAVDFFWVTYLTGTLTAYGLFPYFPSLPPRLAFPFVEPPLVTTWVRTLNLWLLRGVTIHSGVFPSAHVSSAFSATWALYLIFPHRRWLGHSLLIYSISVSLATVYGRYHYLADVLGGFGVSLIALAVAYATRPSQQFVKI
jgi:membrane-associated phospholipid phosphatase